MADRITLDFETNTITWDTDAQKGTELCVSLAKRKPQILAAMGYEPVDLQPVADVVNTYMNGEIDKDEFLRRMDNLSES